MDKGKIVDVGARNGQGWPPPCAGDVVIELPPFDPEFRRLPLGRMCAVYEYHPDRGLIMLEDVMGVTLRITASDLTMADVAQVYPASYIPTRQVRMIPRLSTWIVVGFKERA